MPRKKHEPRYIESDIIPTFSGICGWCEHWTPGFRKCAAFPKEIPMAIWMAENDHREPYPGDHGIQYQAYVAPEQDSERQAA